MIDAEIYKMWLGLIKGDHRYFRQRRWQELKKIIETEEVHTVLEFGAGVSTLLFDNLGFKVYSVETDTDYGDFVAKHCSDNVIVTDEFPNPHALFDLAFVDGPFPRIDQTQIAVKQAAIVAIDDFAGRIKRVLTPLVDNLERLDSATTYLAVFKVL